MKEHISLQPGVGSELAAWKNIYSFQNALRDYWQQTANFEWRNLPRKKHCQGSGFILKGLSTGACTILW